MVSESLAAFARMMPIRPAVGLEFDVTAERVFVFMPSFPIAGPNSVERVRCAEDRLAVLLAEAEATFVARGLPYLWKLDAETRPSDLGERLTDHGFPLREELTCLALPIDTRLPGVAGVEVRDALATDIDFHAAERVQAAGFGQGAVTPGADQRLRDARADPARRLVLALIDGEPAGAGWATLAPEGTYLNGGAVHPRFQGRGVYRALLAARRRLAADAGSAGLVTHARPTSRGILLRMGFEAVGHLRLHARPPVE